MPPKPVVLCILDGWGLSADTTANAPALADTPNFDRIWQSCPTTELAAHGPDVGLPEGQMGNSEVGHMNIGAGRIVWMDLPKIDAALANGSFQQNPALTRFIARLKETGGTAHVMGLLSDGGVHSHISHLIATVKALSAAGIPVAVHAFLDGRDVAPKSAEPHLEALEAALTGTTAFIVSITGRFYAMDRDTRWDRIETAYTAMAHGKGHKSPWRDALAAAYEAETTDEFVEPIIPSDYSGMADGDGLFFINFRADRAREILSAFLDPAFDGFETGPRPKITACGMVEYSDAHNQWMDVMYPSEDIANTLGEWLAKQGKTQFRLAETEKYPHVTFFLNGGVETPNPDEDRTIAPSPKVRTYDLKPEMSAEEVGDQLVSAIENQKHDAIIVNFANPDMVGHTGDLAAAMSACAAVDHQLGRALKALETTGGAILVTADHGNCEVMVDPDTGGPHTAHTLNPVPLILVGGPQNTTLKTGGRLADLAPTLLALMQTDQPPEMTGQSLLKS